MLSPLNWQATLCKNKDAGQVTDPQINTSAPGDGRQSPMVSLLGSPHGCGKIDRRGCCIGHKGVKLVKEPLFDSHSALPSAQLARRQEFLSGMLDMRVSLRDDEVLNRR
jgi:hypothetical protein